MSVVKTTRLWLELLQELRVENYKITAVDINTSANEVYRLSHLKSSDCRHSLLERNIQSFSVNEIDRMKIDLLTMSPPCQPFSRFATFQWEIVLKICFKD